MRLLAIFLVVLVAIGVIGATMAAYTVDERKHALVLRFGKLQTEKSEPGLYFKFPVADEVVYLDKRVLDLDASPKEVIAQDQKRYVVDAYLKFRIANPLEFYRTQFNVANAERTLDSLLESNMREVLGDVPFSMILTGQRADLMNRIQILMNEEAEEFGINVIDVRIRRSDLPEQNARNVFERMRTEREQEAREIRARGEEQARAIRARADRDVTVLLAEADRKSNILRGEGDAARAKIFADAYGQDADFFAFYRAMQAYETALQSGDTLVLSPDSEFFRYFGDPQGVTLGRVTRDEN